MFSLASSLAFALVFSSVLSLVFQGQVMSSPGNDMMKSPISVVLIDGGQGYLMKSGTRIGEFLFLLPVSRKSSVQL